MTDKTGTSLLPAVQSNTQNNQGMKCHICWRRFPNNRELLQHLNTCHQRNIANLGTRSNNESDENNDNEVQPEQQHEEFCWNTVLGREYQKDLEEPATKYFTKVRIYLWYQVELLVEILLIKILDF